MKPCTHDGLRKEVTEQINKQINKVNIVCI